MNAATMTLARYYARKAIKAQMQRQGLKVCHVEHSEIVRAADSYLREHPELIEQAAETVRLHPDYEH